MSIANWWVAVGQLAFRLYLPAVFFMALAYVGLFHFFAVAFRTARSSH